jgi:hypothetical protein
MKKLVIGVFVLLASATFAQEREKLDVNKRSQKQTQEQVQKRQPGSQAQTTPEQRTEEIVRRLNEKSNLSAQQQSQVRGIILERERQRDKDNELYAENRRKIDEQVRARNKQFDQRLQRVLNNEQFQALEEIRSEIRASRDNASPQKRGDERLDVRDNERLDVRENEKLDVRGTPPN